MDRRSVVCTHTLVRGKIRWEMGRREGRRGEGAGVGSDVENVSQKEEKKGRGFKRERVAVAGVVWANA